jgi:serralysin
MSHSSVFDGSAVLVATHNIPGLAIGASLTDSVTITGTTAGNWYVFAVADYNHAIASASQEPDNASSGVAFNVQAPQSIYATAVNDTAYYGQSLAAYTVHDLGTKITVSGPDAFDTLYGMNHLHFADGTVNVNDGNPLFDSLYYDRMYTDVFHAGVNPLAHFNGGGFKEGRNPNEFFDTFMYLGANAAVRKAGLNPLDHYDQVGWKQGLDPSLDFSTKAYLIHNPDVAASGIDPLVHFLTSGQAEGRQAYKSLGISVNGFDAEYYAAHNKDVVQAGADLLQHYLIYGWKEGRDPNPYFSTNQYLAHYADVAAAGVNPLLQYESSGWLEGRSPSSMFDGVQYLANNPDVAALHLNPLDHYVNNGYYEGRIGFSDGLFYH